jgi:hypothetical protein
MVLIIKDRLAYFIVPSWITGKSVLVPNTYCHYNYYNNIIIICRAIVFLLKHISHSREMENILPIANQRAALAKKITFFANCLAIGCICKNMKIYHTLLSNKQHSRENENILFID